MPEIKAPEEILPPSSPEEIIPEEIDTSNWKTYRNEEFSFEVKLPKNLIVKGSKSKIEFMSEERGIYVGTGMGIPVDITDPSWPVIGELGEIGEWLESRGGRRSPNKDTPVLYFFSQLLKKSAEEAIADVAYEGEKPQRINPKEAGIMQDIPYPLYLISHTLEWEGREYFIFDVGKNRSLMIYHPVTNCLSYGPKLEEELTFYNQCELFEQILSTFRFLE